MIGTGHVQSPTLHARALPSVDIYGQLSQPAIGPEPKSPKFWIQSSLESPENRRMRRRRLPDTRPIPEGVREPIYIRKKCAIWT